MAILNFSDVLMKVGLDPQKVKLIRHALSDERFRECYKAGMAHEYTRHQKKEFSKGYDYWVTFISDGGTYARLHSCYCVNGSVPDTPDVCPAGLPDCESKEYRGENAFFDLQYVDILKEYEGKLVIDWGGAARMCIRRLQPKSQSYRLNRRTRNHLSALKISFYPLMN